MLIPRQHNCVFVYNSKVIDSLNKNKVQHCWLPCERKSKGVSAGTQPNKTIKFASEVTRLCHTVQKISMASATTGFWACVVTQGRKCATKFS